MAILERIIMADAMQGIMSLPPEMGGMDQGPQSFFTPEDEATLNQLRSSISPREFSDEMFNAAEQVDPQAVSQLRMMLQGLQLPAELIDLIKQMVDMLLSDPSRYQEMRQQFLMEGVPEELLPQEFDPNFFAALNMALDQVSGPVVQGFAGGGMAMTPIAGGIAGLGRYGDTMLAHITPQEAMMLRRAGGAGSINPMTGLPEFFNLFKAIGSAFKSVGNAVKSVVKGIGSAISSFAKSTVGRLVTTVALGFLLGPAAASLLGVSSAAGVAAISGFIGGAGSTLLAGGSFKDALKAGAVGGLTAGAGSYLSGGAQAFQAGSYTGPTTVAGQWRSFAQGLADKTGVNLPGSQPQVDLARPSPYDVGMVTPEMAAMPPTAPITQQAALGGQGSMQSWQNPVDAAARAPVSVEAAAVPSPIVSARPLDIPAGTPAAPAVETAGIGSLQQAGDAALRNPNLPRVGPELPNATVAGTPPQPSYRELLGKGDVTGMVKQAGSDVMGAYDKYLSPTRPAMQEAMATAETKAIEAVNRLPAGTPESIQLATYKRVLEANTPGMLSTYGPLAAATLSTAYLGGAFNAPPTPKPKLPPSGVELFERNPYLITPRVSSYSASTGAPVRYAAQGGVMSLAGGTQHFPRKTGPVDGPGNGTSDSIPAMLSDGEFVFTAKAVRAMGKGSRRKGAKRMYALMKALEKRA
jgi:hypothetical protein